MRRFLVLILAAALASSAPVSAVNTALATEEFMVPSDTPGIQLYVRNKHPRGQNAYAPEKVVLFLHGAVTPSETVLDIPLGGISWMDYIAQSGYDVYLVDVRGYGRSTRPPEMDQPANANPPIVRSDVWLRDLSSAIDFIKKRRNVQKVVLTAWSFGTQIIGAYAAAHNEGVAKLVLYAPEWLRTASTAAAASAPLPAYRSVSIPATKATILSGVPPDKKATLIPDGWFEQWATATWATDPNASKTNPPLLRAPNGWAADDAEYWLAGKPYYDPSKITVPTMLVHSEWDAILPVYITQDLWKQLTSTPYKRYVEIGEGTHHLFMEKNRMQLFREVQLFLDDTYKPPE